MVEQQRALADDAHADEHHHHRDQNAGHAERVVDQQASQPGTRPAAEISRLDAQRGTFLGREQQPALVGRPGKNENSTAEAANTPMKSSSNPATQRALSLLERWTFCRPLGDEDVFLDAICVALDFYQAKLRIFSTFRNIAM